MRLSQTGDVWWKSAVFYCADVETFQDSDGDGIGDLRGMTERIEYLADLGVTCLWLMPIYPTAGRDDGYDITDFFGVDPRLGTLGDFVELVRTARSRGIRVVVDFVMNHTSDKHPWFKSARRSVDDPYRQHYVWSATKPPSGKAEVVFPDVEDSIWELDEKTGEWFLHHFYKTQPDLNVANPAVQEEIARTLGFWLALGVAGFRIDAVPFLFANDTYPGSEPGGFDPLEYLKDVRDFVTRRLGRRRAPGRGQPPLPAAEGVLRRRGRRRAQHAVRLHRDAASLPLPRPCGCRPARGRAARAARPRRDEPVGQLRAQPRRADPRQAERRRAQGGLRGIRTRPRHAALRPRASPPPPDDARRRPAPHPPRLLADVLPPGHADAVLRRGDRHGREPRRRGTPLGAHPHAVGCRPQRWLLRPHRSGGSPVRSRPACGGPTT